MLISVSLLNSIKIQERSTPYQKFWFWSISGLSVYTILYSRLAVFVTNKARSPLTRFARSLLQLASLAQGSRPFGPAIEHYRGRVLNHGRACQRCDIHYDNTYLVIQEECNLENPSREHHSPICDLPFKY